MTHWIFPGIENGEINAQISEAKNTITIICKKLGISELDFYGKTRRRRICDARKIVAFNVLEKYPKIKLITLGNIMNKDHTTIIYQRDQYNFLYGNDTDFKNLADLIWKKN